MNWRELNKRLSGMNEEEVQAMLDAEMAADRRVTVVERLHQRVSALRVTRERLALLQACKERRNG